MRRTALSGLALTALTVSGAFGYIRQYVDTARTIPYYRPDHAAIQYLINNQIAAGHYWLNGAILDRGRLIVALVHHVLL